MSAVKKFAAIVFATGLLTGAGAAVAAPVFAAGTVAAAEETPAAEPVTQADVDAAFAVFKTAQADARASEKQAISSHEAEEKAVQDQVKNAKGSDKRAAQEQLATLRAENRVELKELREANRATVAAAKAEYQRVAAEFEEQNAAPQG